MRFGRKLKVLVALKQCAVLNGFFHDFFNAQILKAEGNTGGRLDIPYRTQGPEAETLPRKKGNV